MQLAKNTKEYGFTLIEMLVSVALFSVVLTAALGAIITIADSNKKARSLMSVTNNLNFAVDSMVRSFKTGNDSFVDIDGDGECFQTDEIDYTKENFTTRTVEYCFDEIDGRGEIIKSIEGNPTALTSSDVDIDSLIFKSSNSGQPILTISMTGTVKVSERIRSTFSIQTAVSQRKLKI